MSQEIDEKAFIHKFFPELDVVSIKFVYSRLIGRTLAYVDTWEDLKREIFLILGGIVLLGGLIIVAGLSQTDIYTVGAGIAFIVGVFLIREAFHGWALTPALRFLFGQVHHAHPKWIVFVWTGLHNMESHLRDFVLGHELAHISYMERYGYGVENYIDEITSQRLSLSDSDVKSVRQAVQDHCRKHTHLPL